MKTVTLNTWDRATLIAVLSAPQRGANWTRVHKLGQIYDTLDFTEKEIVAFGLQEVGGRITPDGTGDTEFELSDTLFELLKEVVDNFDAWHVPAYKQIQALREKLGLPID